MLAFLLTVIASALAATAIPAFAAPLEARDVSPADSITYCSLKDRGNEEQYYVPCTKTSHPLSEVTFEMPYLVNSTFNNGRLAAHYECYVETAIGDRYLAGHPAGGQEPCWVTASLLGPTPTCSDPTPEGSTCGCQKAQLASCCAFRAEGNDLNGYLNASYVHCP